MQIIEHIDCHSSPTSLKLWTKEAYNHKQIAAWKAFPREEE
jgi:hypothetical protein